MVREPGITHERGAQPLLILRSNSMEEREEQDRPEYDLDADTLNLLQTSLELALMSSNLQLQTDTQRLVADIVIETARRFGIYFEHVVKITDQESTQLDMTDWPFNIRVLDKDDADDHNS